MVIRRGDEPAWIQTYGLAQVEQASVMQPETVLPIASITKAFVATAILLLEQDGKLSTSDPLSNFLPDYPNATNITLAQLLTHTSGVPNFVSVPAFADNQAKDWTPQELVALFEKLPPSFPPGEKCLYSDSGFILLGLVIEKASGQSFGDYIREHITGPLAMPSTMTGSNKPIIPWRAAGYTGKPDAWQNAPYISQTTPFTAGGMMSNPGDLINLADVLMPGGPLLQPANRAAMIAPAPLSGGGTCSYPLPGAKGSFGYGLELVTFDSLPDNRAIGKSGVFPGFGGYLVAFENTDISMVLLANGDGSMPKLVELSPRQSPRCCWGSRQTKATARNALSSRAATGRTRSPSIMDRWDPATSMTSSASRPSSVLPCALGLCRCVRVALTRLEE